MDSSDKQIGKSGLYTGINSSLCLVLKVDLQNDYYRAVNFRHESENNEDTVRQNDVYRVVDFQPGSLAADIEECGKYSDWLYIFGDNFIHEDDNYDFHRNLNLKVLKKLYANSGGKMGYWVRFSVKIGSEYCVCSFELLADENNGQDNSSIYLVIKRLDKELDGRISIMEDIFRAMGDTFTSIYYIDFRSDRVIPYRLNSEMSGENQDLLACYLSYDAIFNSSLIKIVAKKHQDRILNILDKENLKRRIATEGTFSVDFPANYNGRDCYLRLRAANISKDVHQIDHVAIGISDITVDKLEYDNFYKIGRSVLVVEDNEINREILCSIIEDEYQLFEAENGAEALKILEDNYEDIAAVITDLEMPVMNGYELLDHMYKNGKYSSIPIIVTTASDDVETEVACLSLGASDFVTKPYNAEVVKNRLKSLVRLKESTAMLNTLAKDSLTGLYTREFFFKLAEDILKHSNVEEYQIFCVHIENLKMINDKYSSKGGDEVLAYVAKNLKDVIPGYDVGGVISGSTYAALGKKCSVKELKEALLKLRRNAPIVNLSVKCGFCSIYSDLSLANICDRAILAIEKISGSYDVMVAEYDDILRQNMAKQQQILDNMEEALVKHQFCVYYQPSMILKMILPAAPKRWCAGSILNWAL
ncbi:response regulator [bacterium]|nr:response regulator [bacterium]